jgi:lipoprotein NlpI
MRRIAVLILACQSLLAQSPQARVQIGLATDEFFAGRIKQAVEGYDKAVQMDPSSMPYLWQRGLAQYYAGQYKQCKAQFEAHRTVNPNDVENPVWHFLCTAKAESLEKARASILPVGPDSRVPMPQVYLMFAGKADPESVLRLAGNNNAAKFMANLYVGLYYDVTGDKQKAKLHIAEAANERYARDGDFMYQIARIHNQQLRN